VEDEEGGEEKGNRMEKNEGEKNDDMTEFWY